MYTIIDIYIHIYTHIYVCKYSQLSCFCMPLWLTYMFVCMCMNVYICFSGMYVYIYIYIYTHQENMCLEAIRVEPTYGEAYCQLGDVYKVFILQCVAVCCSVVQCGAAYCSVLQCFAVFHLWHAYMCTHPVVDRRDTCVTHEYVYHVSFMRF